MTNILDTILDFINKLLGDSKTTEQTTTPTTTQTTTTTPTETLTPIQPITIAETQPVTTIETISPITITQPETTITTIPVVEPISTTTQTSTPTPTPTTTTQTDPNIYTSNTFKGKLYYANSQPPTALNQTVYFGRYEMANGQSVNIWMSKHSVGLTFWSDHNGGSGEFLEWQKLVQWIDANYPWSYGGTNVHYQN